VTLHPALAIRAAAGTEFNEEGAMRRNAMLALAVLLAACEAPTSPMTGTALGPSAQVIRNDHFETQTVAINDCNGEIIAIDATIHLVTSVTNDGAGGYHVKIHRNVSGSGVNEATGVEYVVSEEDNNEYSVSAGASEQTSIVHFNLVSKGNAPNEVAEVTFHLTITPDGDLVTYHDGTRIDCGM
jgi:hypothetical protein